MPEKKDFIAMFKAEAEERLTKINNGLVELEKHPENLELIKELNRQAHTIKGSSKVFGFTEIQDISHRIEETFEKIAAKKIAFNSKVANQVFKELDAIKISLEKIDEEQKETAPQIPQPSTPVEVVRVQLNRVDKLLNLVGEMVISKMQASEKLIKIKKLTKLSKETQGALADLSTELKNEFSFAGTEAEKILSLCSANAQRLSQESLNLYEHFYNEAIYLDPIIDELQNKVKELRMLPCSTIFEGFPRMLRDIAVAQGKEINLEISGEDTELDKKVLEGIKPSLIHILRNCIDHGIETTQKRKALGKPEAGAIKLCASGEAGKVIITVEDDGQGIDLDEVKETAVKKALVSRVELEKMTEKETLSLIFMNGYSTSQIVTEVSGRGIGLDIVRRDIENLKGGVVLEAEKDKGVKFSLILPLTIAVSKALLAKTGGMTFAFPMTFVSECVDVSSQDISTLEGRMCIQVREHSVPVVRLDDVLGFNSAQTNEGEASPKGTNDAIPVVIAQYFEKKVGFLVEEIVSEADIFVKNLGPHLGKVKNVSGATILGTGEVVVILDVADLISSSTFAHPVVSGEMASAIGSRTTAPWLGIISQKIRVPKRILVVESALTTRVFEKSILESKGYLVDTAVDGLDALSKLQEFKYDLIISDIQMPRMDGFELCRKIKQSEAYKDIPVAMVTALEKEEDKRQGMEAGVSAYIVKSAFDQKSLIDTVERFIG